MQRLLFTALTLLFSISLQAQFSTDQLQFRFGYNIHNTGAKSVNTLIDDFNNQRYPHIISRNLNSLNWPTGLVFGGNYVFREDMIFYGNFKSRRQYLEAPYTYRPDYRKYLFRAYTLEAGLMVPLRDDDFFSHYAGGGLLLGVMQAYTAWERGSGYTGSRNMVSIDNSGIIGLSLAYEAQLRLHRLVRVYARPVAQFALRSPMRRLTDFMDPIVDAGGQVTYGQGLEDKYDRASFNGIGIEGGLLILLPEID